MKLYLSSYRIPVPEALANLLGKPLAETTVALIPNAKDYYAKRPWEIKVNDMVEYLKALGLKVDIVDLREYDSGDAVRIKMQPYDLIWAMGGNTYILRYEMRRSGFEQAINELLGSGIVFGGDSAGALVAGPSIAGVEEADDPTFAEELITEGLNLIPELVLPHVDNPSFSHIPPTFKTLHSGKKVIELKDSQAAVFNDEQPYKIVEASH